jgi:hypothetical protein
LPPHVLQVFLADWSVDSSEGNILMLAHLSFQDFTSQQIEAMPIAIPLRGKLWVVS